MLVSTPVKLGKKVRGAFCQATAALACCQVKHGYYQPFMLALSIFTPEENLHNYYPHVVFLTKFKGLEDGTRQLYKHGTIMCHFLHSQGTYSND